MVEWSITTVLKTVVPRGTGGSNPSLSAKKAAHWVAFFVYAIRVRTVLSVAVLGESVPAGRAQIPLSPQCKTQSFENTNGCVFRFNLWLRTIEIIGLCAAIALHNYNLMEVWTVFKDIYIYLVKQMRGKSYRCKRGA